MLFIKTYLHFFLLTSIIFLCSTNAIAQNEYKNLDEVKGLAIGQEVPVIEAIDQHYNLIRLHDLLSNGPVVIIFYRGFWCPICNQHLSELQERLKTLKSLGVSVVAISPEKPEYLIKTSERTGAEFILLYDEDYQISNAFDLAFQPDSATVNTLEELLNIDLTLYHSDESQRLPVPATFIVNTDGVIVWRQFNPDYRDRSEFSEILRNLPK